MTNCELVDAYIADCKFGIGDTFRLRDFRLWLTIQGLDGVVNPSAALAAHRYSPDGREYTLERVGWGPNAFRRIVETPTHVAPKAVRWMSDRIAGESVMHWRNEAVYQMWPLARHDKRANKILREVEAQWKAIAVLAGVKLDALYSDND